MSDTPTLTAYELADWRLLRLARLRVALEQCASFGLLSLERVHRLHDHKGTLVVTQQDLAERERWLLETLWRHLGNEDCVEFVPACPL